MINLIDKDIGPDEEMLVDNDETNDEVIVAQEGQEINEPDDVEPLVQSLWQRSVAGAQRTWLVTVGVVVLIQQAVQAGYRRFNQDKEKQALASDASVTQSLSERAQSEDMLSEDALSEDKTEPRERFTLGFFKRMTLQGALLESPLIREEFGTTNESGDRNSVVILATKAYINTRQFLRGATVSAGDRLIELTQDAFEIGEQYVQESESIRSRLGEIDTSGFYAGTVKLRQKLWHSLGLVDSQDIEVLQHQINTLVGPENEQEFQPLSAIASSDRRHRDRRNVNMTVVYNRRQKERRAA